MRLRIVSVSECAHIYVWFIYVFVLICAPVHVEARSLCQMFSSITVPYILNLELMDLIG